MHPSLSIHINALFLLKRNVFMNNFCRIVGQKLVYHRISLVRVARYISILLRLEKIQIDQFGQKGKCDQLYIKRQVSTRRN